MPSVPAPTKRLALFFDGTWNTPEDKTNVWELSNPADKPEHKKNGRIVPTGIVQTVNERIDPSAFRRCQRYSDAGSNDYYRPASLLEWAQRKNLHLEKIIAAPEPPSEFTAPVTQPGIH